MGRPLSKSATTIAAVGIANNLGRTRLSPQASSSSFQLDQQQQQDKDVVMVQTYPTTAEQNAPTNSNNPAIGQQPQQQLLPLLRPERGLCKPPLSRKFGHPCNCGQLANHLRWSLSGGTGRPLPPPLIATSNINNLNNSNNNQQQQQLPAAAYFSPLYLYDPVSRRCLPTSRNRDMLLKECLYHPNNNNLRSPEILYSSPTAATSTVATPTNSRSHSYNQHCYYDDLICDARKMRCVCKPSMHLYYDTNQTLSFACVPIGNSGVNCRPGYVYNVISRECQRLFDVNELPPTHPIGFSATQSSFVSIVLIWILLLIFSIVATKLGKLRNPNLYSRSSPSGSLPATFATGLSGSGRRQAAGRAIATPVSTPNGTQTGSSSSAWLHPFLSAVNGHQPSSGADGGVDGVDGANQRLGQTRTASRRLGTRAHSLNDSADLHIHHQCDDNQFILITHGNQQRRIRIDDSQFVGSQLSLNNPPPKFEEIYPPTCPAPDLLQQQHQHQQQHYWPPAVNYAASVGGHIGPPLQQPPSPSPPLPSNEDLPTYDEAMRLVNKTMPPDSKA